MHRFLSLLTIRAARTAGGPRTPRGPTVITWLALALPTLLLAACDQSAMPFPPGAGATLGDPGAGPPPIPLPRPCETADDCRDACPPTAVGCTCVTLPTAVCAPTCSVDSDCPSIPDGPPGRCLGEVCAPPPPPPPGLARELPDDAFMPRPCQGDDECGDACPPGSTSCACVELPPLSLCAPTCATDSDCPSFPGGPPGRCLDEVCAPPFLPLPPAPPGG